MTNNEIFKNLAFNNEHEYNILKTIEELNELATVLAQALTKREDIPHIVEELGDVKIRLKILDYIYPGVDDRVNEKCNKYRSYIDQGKYIGRI